jgi:hypothetical protein
MLGERRGQGSIGRAFTCAIEGIGISMQSREDTNELLGLRKDRVATAAVLLAIAVSLAGACIVILESTTQSPPPRQLTIATAE